MIVGVDGRGGVAKSEQSSGTGAVLRADQLTIGYAGRVVGSQLSLSVFDHEILCLLGPNGSGKSTLFKTMLGLIPALAGKVYVNGTPLKQWTRADLARRAAYVPQAQSGTFPFTVHEIVLMGRSARLGRFSSPSRRDHEFAMHCLDQMGIADLSERRYTEISGGERQLALIARALAQEPLVMVMDEPTASLDFGNQIRVLDYVRKMRAQGMGVLLCTHQPDHALRVSDRIVMLKAGQLRALAHQDKSTVLASLAWLYDLDESVLASSLPPFLEN